MKYILLLIICLSGISCKSKMARTNNDSVTFRSEIVAKKQDTLVLNTHLINNNNHCLSYLTMSCDSLINYEVDTENWKMVDKRICDNNFPISQCLSSRDSVHHIIHVIPLGRKKTSKLKIGFKLFHDPDLTILSEKANQTIWDTITVSKQ